MALLLPVALSGQFQAGNTKSLDEFGSCFARLQEQAGRVWSFIPNDEGGVFTDQGGRGVVSPFRFQVREAAGQLRLLVGSIANRRELLKVVARCR